MYICKYIYIKLFLYQKHIACYSLYLYDELTETSKTISSTMNIDYSSSWGF